MAVKVRMSEGQAATVAGLVTGSTGIGLLWAGGVDFPVYPPPGIVILLVGALIVGLGRWRWAPGVGAFLGLFVIVGFLISPEGTNNLMGDHGTTVAVGTVIQLIGVITTLAAGVIATRRNYRGARSPR